MLVVKKGRRLLVVVGAVMERESEVDRFVNKIKCIKNVVEDVLD